MPACSRFFARKVHASVACAVSIFALVSCGGSGDAADDTADLPPITNDEGTITPNAALGRLVYGSFDQESQPALDLLKQHFTQQQLYAGTSALQKGDVLVIDGRTITPADLKNSGQLAAQAYEKQIPIIIVGFDDVLEEATHALIPTISAPGFSTVALLMPPRSDQAPDTGGLFLSQAQPAGKSLVLQRRTANHLVNQLLRYRSSSANLAQQDAAGAPTCTATSGGDTDPCRLVKSVGFKALTVEFAGSFEGSECLSRDWYALETIGLGAFGRSYAGYSGTGSAIDYQAQCPSQVVTITPTLYKNSVVDENGNPLPSRFLTLSFSASLNPGPGDTTGNNLVGWYQTRHRLNVALDKGFMSLNGALLKAHAPTTQNGSTNVQDSFQWGLSGQINGKGGEGGGEAGGQFGWSVGFSHTVTNNIPDWQFIDNSVAQAWSFEAQQTMPYRVQGSGEDYKRDAPGSEPNCANMGNFLFIWAGTHCHALLEHARHDKLKPLSTSTMSINGMVAWDLGPDNNQKTDLPLYVTMTSFYDAAGCTRKTKHSRDVTSPGQHISNSKLDAPHCTRNQSDDGLGTWYARSMREVTPTFKLNLSTLSLD